MVHEKVPFTEEDLIAADPKKLETLWEKMLLEIRKIRAWKN